MHYFSYLLLRGLLLLIGWLPFWLLYLLADLLYILLYHLLGYRKKVVYQNLERAFPNTTLTARKDIAKQFYQHLCTLLVESLKGFSLSPAQLKKRQILSNPELVQAYFDQGKSVLIVGGHYANWEWAARSAALFVDGWVSILFSPMKNPYVQRFMQQARGQNRTELWPSNQALRAFRSAKDRPTAFVMIADQAPSTPKRAHWIYFLEQPTPVFRGPARYAQQQNLPLLFVDIQVVKRGHYTMTLKVLAEDPNAHSPAELSARYMKALETCIRAQPSYWLWSHRRWKHKAPADFDQLPNK